MYMTVVATCITTLLAVLFAAHKHLFLDFCLKKSKHIKRHFQQLSELFNT